MVKDCDGHFLNTAKQAMGEVLRDAEEATSAASQAAGLVMAEGAEGGWERHGHSPWVGVGYRINASSGHEVSTKRSLVG